MTPAATRGTPTPPARASDVSTLACPELTTEPATRMSGWSAPKAVRGNWLSIVRFSLPSRLSTANVAVAPAVAVAHGVPGSVFPRTHLTWVTAAGPLTVTFTVSLGIGSLLKTL